MLPEGPTEAARALLAARSELRRLYALPEACRPETIEDGYAVQDTFAREWDLDVIGWKIACTARDQQKLLGVSEPFRGRLFAPFLYESPAEPSATAFHALGLEAEFAFRLGRAMPPRRKPYSRDDVAGAAKTLHPAIEIVSPRFQDWTKVGAPSLVADNAVNGGLVLGAAVKDWRDVNLARQRVRLEVNGETVGRGTGSKVLGHPLAALEWLANHLSARGIGLKGGQIVTTGTCTGIYFAKQGDVAVAHFGRLGEVRVAFTK